MRAEFVEPQLKFSEHELKFLLTEEGDEALEIHYDCETISHRTNKSLSRS